VAIAAQACRRHPDRTRLTTFLASWLDFQGHYFGHSLGGARRWARSAAARPGALEGTAAARRRRRWRELGRRLEAERPQLPPTADALGGWVDKAGEDELAQRLRAERTRCTHLCAYPYDGFGTFWGEDPTPLWREIQGSRGRRDPGPDPTIPDDPASEILRLGEDDNERLMGSYWLLRRVLHALAPALHCRQGTELLDLLPRDLFEALGTDSADQVARARSRGRALYLQWRGALAGDVAADGPRIQGRCAVEGRARGPVWVGRTLDQLGPGAATPPIAVVSVVTPGDAIYFDRIAGLVCEGGDRLGHASILAREYGVPCIVQVGRVSRRLAGVRHALLDADAGELLPQHGSDIDHGGRS
jgi:phosphohistidine swiveling domain-containing protein